MPIKGIIQPDLIQIDDTLRLRKFDGQFSFAYEWYQDIDTVYMVDGVKEPYTSEKLKGMYDYLNEHGEEYFIEVLENDTYKPIGDVTFSQKDMPIVIGDKNYRRKHIAHKVISALIQRGKELGYDKIYVNEIYDFNNASRKCFESLGFQAYMKTDKGNRFVLDLK